jgi:hypothetical protein
VKKLQGRLQGSVNLIRIFLKMIIVLSDDIKYIIEDTTEIKPLITVIGNRCNEVIILASDS